MQDRKKALEIMGVILVFCFVMAVVDGILMANYFLKSGIKLVLFLGVPFLYTRKRQGVDFQSLFSFDKKSLCLAFCLCIPVYIIILGGYFLFQNIFDFSGITKSLTQNIGVNRGNFLLVSLYISFVNSLLEEFFFRGFGFLILKRFASRRLSYCFSALIFAGYHVAMMIGWFSLGVFVIVLTGLFVGGLVFNYLDEKTGTIYPSWFVHMFANFAINTIGFILFGVL